MRIISVVRYLLLALFLLAVSAASFAQIGIGISVGFAPPNSNKTAAVRGEGVVLGRSALVADELAGGRLVRPFELSLPAGFAYYVVYPQRALQRPSVKAFRDWLMAEAR